MEDNVRINIQVGELKHPLTVPKDEEPIYREAARLVNERLVTYQTKYRAANLPHDFMMAFAALDIAARYVRLQHNTDTGPTEKAISDLTDEIKAFLQTDNGQF